MDAETVLAIVAGLAAVWAVLVVLLWVLRPKEVPMREVVRVVPDLVRLLRSLLIDGSTPLDVRLVLAGLVVWLLSPIDLIPDFLPGIGVLDDVVLTIVAVRYTRRRVGVERLRARWAGSPDGFALLLRVIGTGGAQTPSPRA
jgi:uncharacterized membrane protein YkvA (DUF1232 family)